MIIISSSSGIYRIEELLYPWELLWCFSRYKQGVLEDTSACLFPVLLVTLPFFLNLTQQDGALSRCVSQCCCCCFWCLDKCLRHLNQVRLLRWGHTVWGPASGRRLLGQGLASFSVKARLCKSFQGLGHLGLGHSYSALLPQQKSSHRQDVTGWAWVCSSRALLTGTEIWILFFVFAPLCLCYSSRA